MAIQTEPTRIQIPFADSGTKNVIPDTNSTPSASQAASWTDGFPAQCSLPLSAGGIPPARADFNGIFHTLSQSARFTQEGGVWAWDATVDYGTNRVVLGSDGLLYWSVAQSGPNLGGAQDPTADTSHTYWASPKVPTMPASDSSSSAASTAWVGSWYASQPLRKNYYIDPVNGDDSNDGTTAATAFKTQQPFISILTSSIFPIPNDLTLNLAAGSYGDDLNAAAPGVSVNIAGPSSGEASFTSAHFTMSNAIVTFTGRFQFTGRFYVSRGTSVVLQDCYINFHNLGAITDAFYIYNGGILSSLSNFSQAFEFSGTIAWNQGCMHVLSGGMVVFNGANHTVTTSGTVTGRRYRLSGCALVYGTGSATFFPGTTTGDADASSFYS